jgi:hypothetical protein
MAPRKPDSAPAATRRSRRLQNEPAPVPEVASGPHITTDNRVTKPKPKPKPKRRDCVICGSEKATSSFPRKPPTSTCKHEVNTCTLCTKTHITVQLDSNTHDKLACPECPEILQNADVKRLGTKQAHARYDELERKAIAENTPGWRWCLNPKCRAGQVHKSLIDLTADEDEEEEAQEPPAKKSKGKGGKAGKKSKSTKKKKKKKTKSSVYSEDICVCHACSFRVCVPCDRPYHEGETCAQFRKRLTKVEKDEQASLKAIEEKTKECPKCKKHIEKNGGCDQLICEFLSPGPYFELFTDMDDNVGTQCGDRFCWVCTTSYEVIDKDGHAQGCRYAAPGAVDPHAAPNAPGGIDNPHNGGGGGAAGLIPPAGHPGGWAGFLGALALGVNFGGGNNNINGGGAPGGGANVPQDRPRPRR